MHYIQVSQISIIISVIQEEDNEEIKTGTLRKPKFPQTKFLNGQFA